MHAEEITELYGSLGPMIYRRCLRVLGDTHMAEDTTQEVFVRLVLEAGRLDSTRAYLPWLYRVATNLCIDRLRRAERTTPMSPADLPEMPVPSGEATLAAREVTLQLLDGTDERGRQIAIHYFVDRMTQEEIAAVMGISRRTIGKRLKRLVAMAEGLRGEAHA